jgi:Txe/YoeB family toxin of toxin-antitoxin system
VKWTLKYTKHARKDSKKILGAGLKPQVEKILNILEEDPYQSPPRFEKLVGDLTGSYSRNINIQHRIIYQILKKEKIVKILKMWTHYE